MHEGNGEDGQNNDCLPDAVELRVRVDRSFLDPAHEATARRLYLSLPAQLSR